MQQVDKFIHEWTKDPSGVKEIFLRFYQWMSEKEDVRIDFNARPGVSYSLRCRHLKQTDRPLFVMADIIDDDPENRWLSVCFYGDMITDPEEQGDLIPGGLLGADGYCFDLTESDMSLADYIGQRIEEACEKADMKDPNE